MSVTRFPRSLGKRFIPANVHKRHTTSPEDARAAQIRKFQDQRDVEARAKSAKAKAKARAKRMRKRNRKRK